MHVLVFLCVCGMWMQCSANFICKEIYEYYSSREYPVVVDLETICSKSIVMNQITNQLGRRNVVLIANALPDEVIYLFANDNCGSEISTI